MENPHTNHRIVPVLVVLLFALTFPFAANAAKGGNGGKGGKGKGGGLTLIKALASEDGSLSGIGIAESGETLTYSITLSNKGKKAKTTSVTETVPPGTTYAGDDDFSTVCTDTAAGTSCQLTSVSVPGRGSTTLTFSVIVDNPVTTSAISNSVSASAVDCSTSDCTESMPTAFQTVGQSDWSETSVRKVLHAFAYGGLATDGQIASWAAMAPADAIQQMLTFTYTNELLSPSEDASSLHATSLESLQNFWGDQADVDNPMRSDKRRLYATLTTATDGTTTNFNTSNMQRTWIQAVNARGINPFLHKVAFFLTNYHMSIRASLAGNGLFRSYYDQTATDLVNGEPFTTIIADAAKSAATARRYRHQYNTFNNSNQRFSGNDDFAREFFQLFFRYNGDSETFDYHEGVNIENNAKLLTGMNIDRLTNAYGSNNSNDWYVAPIMFTDHVDDTGRTLSNALRHHQDCLEIFHQQVCGATASDKIDAAAAIVSADPEVRENLPAYIISYFADDQLTPDKIAKIAASWATSGDDLLTFLRAYAISKAFHSEDTVKFRSTFNRNLSLYNTVVLNNEEAFVGRQDYDSPRSEMVNQGGQIFQPAHDVFGGQTGTEASGNPNIFKSAYDAAGTLTTSRLARTNLNYTDSTGTTTIWYKDWGLVAPTTGGQYKVGEIAEWLWHRIVGDGGKNFDIVARSQVIALLARGYDYGYAVTVIDSSISTDPEASWSSAELLEGPAHNVVMNTLASETMELGNSDISGVRRTANSRMNYAANFIAMLPYTFALEGK